MLTPAVVVLRVPAVLSAGHLRGLSAVRAALSLTVFRTLGRLAAFASRAAGALLCMALGALTAGAALRRHEAVFTGSPAIRAEALRILAFLLFSSRETAAETAAHHLVRQFADFLTVDPDTAAVDLPFPVIVEGRLGADVDGAVRPPRTPLAVGPSSRRKALWEGGASFLASARVEGVLS